MKTSFPSSSSLFGVHPPYENLFFPFPPAFLAFIHLMKTTFPSSSSLFGVRLPYENHFFLFSPAFWRSSGL